MYRFAPSFSVVLKQAISLAFFRSPGVAFLVFGFGALVALNGILLARFSSLLTATVNILGLVTYPLLFLLFSAGMAFCFNIGLRKGLHGNDGQGLFSFGVRGVFWILAFWLIGIVVTLMALVASVAVIEISQGPIPDPSSAWGTSFIILALACGAIAFTLSLLSFRWIEGALKWRFNDDKAIEGGAKKGWRLMTVFHLVPVAVIMYGILGGRQIIGLTNDFEDIILLMLSACIGLALYFDGCAHGVFFRLKTGWRGPDDPAEATLTAFD